MILISARLNVALRSLTARVRTLTNWSSSSPKVEAESTDRDYFAAPRRRNQDLSSERRVVGDAAPVTRTAVLSDEVLTAGRGRDGFQLAALRDGLTRVLQARTPGAR